MRRISPVHMPLGAEKTEIRNHFEVVLSYGKKTSNASVVDLSHVSKWEIETGNLDDAMDGTGLTLPSQSNKAALFPDRTLCRMTPSRALIWNFDGGEESLWLQESAFNDVTDGSALLFMTGQGLLSIMEQLTDVKLDLVNGDSLRFAQCPLVGVPAKIVVGINKIHQMGMFVSVARGFGQSVIDTLLLAGKEIGLAPAGEEVFSQWLEKY